MDAYTVLCCFGIAILFSLQVDAGWKCNECDIPIKAIGCFKDKDGQRSLPDLILNERDKYSSVHNGNLIDWDNWNEYMRGFACRCARIASKNGYHHFGLQFYGECWAKKGATQADYEKYGVSKKCIGDDYKKCNKLNRECIGEHWSNFVYEIVSTECEVKFERRGCFNDKHIKGKRPIPAYLLTDRDTSLSISSGKTIDWRNWDVYLPILACRCAKAAKKKGYNTFGLQFYGECWGGADADNRYAKDGISHHCVDKCFKPCKEDEEFCVGKNFANAVYILTDQPYKP